MIKPLYRTQPKKAKKNKLKLLVIPLLVVLLFAYFFVYRPYTNIKAKGLVLVASAKQLKDVFKKNDIDLVKKQMADVNAKYTDFEKASKSVYWAAFIPYVGDFKNGVEAGNYVLKAGSEAVEAIYPYADLIGFKKGQTSFVEKSSEDRLQTAVLTLDKVLGKLDSISANIDEAEKRIAKINPSRYPEKLGKTEVRARIINIKDQFQGVASLFVDAKPFVKNLPNILGKDKEKTYLIIFQNDKERRATGGFLTAYAVFKIKNGKMKIEKSADIYSLDDSIAVHPPAPAQILTYHKGVSKFFIRDSNLSPDFVKSIELFNSLYKNSGEKVNYDGIISLDSKVLVDMLTIFGDTEADGIVFSAKIDQRCDCPEVIYKLFDMVDRPVGYVKTNRKGILGDLMYALFYKAIGFSPSKYWGTLAQTMFKNMDEKHILLYFTDPQIELAVDKLNYAGRIRSFDGDYLHVNNVNFAGAKSNLFVNETITSKTDGKDREVKVVYRNPYPHSDCSLERGGLCLNATLRNWVRVYVPKGSKLKEFKGSLMKVKTYDDLDKTVFEGFLQVVPLGKAEINVTYTLPESVNSDNLMIQKQAGVQGQKYTVTVDGDKVYDGVMEKDQVFKK
ncbi:MAG: hypothetical protein RI947_370 [Candidatus Parcubacteria bacterium]|jgi:hypothetical protein